MSAHQRWSIGSITFTCLLIQAVASVVDYADWMTGRDYVEYSAFWVTAADTHYHMQYITVKRGRKYCKRSSIGLRITAWAICKRYIARRELLEVTGVPATHCIE